MSFMYSLLNHIAATSKDASENSPFSSISINEIVGLAPHSLESSMRGLTEDEKRTVNISTISVAARLALEFQTEEVILSVISNSKDLT